MKNEAGFFLPYCFAFLNNKFRTTKEQLMGNSNPNQPNYKKGALWIILSPILVLMSLISTVKSQNSYYIQIMVFSVLTVAGITTGVGYILAKPWAGIIAKFLTWILGIIFIGIPIVVAIFIIIKKMLD